MFKGKKLFTLVAIILVALVFAIGCTNKDPDQDEVIESNETATKLTDEGKAFQAMLKHDGLNYSTEEINEIAEDGQITVNNEYKIAILDPVTINNKDFYKFERVSLDKGGAASYFVSADTNEVYNEFYDGILKEFNLDNLNSEKVADRKIYILTEKSPHATNTTYIDGKTNKLYSDLSSARKEILAETSKKEPLFNLVGKNSTSVEKETGESLQTLSEEITDELGNSYNMEIKFIDLEKAKIYFHKDGSFDMMEVKKGVNLLGTNVGMTFKEVKNILGEPAAEYQDPGFGDYVLSYDIADINVTFHGEEASGPTYFISVK